MNCPYCNSGVVIPMGVKQFCMNCKAIFDPPNLLGLIDRVANDRTEFCPKCGNPVERSIESTDDARLCETCGWFGDKGEVLNDPPKSDTFNATRAAAQVLELYRDVSRRELVLEQAYDTGNIDEQLLKTAKLNVRSVAHQIIKMFTEFASLRGKSE